MKKLIATGILVSTLCVIGTTFAAGDRHQGNEQRSEKRVLMMQKKLDLTDEQTAKLKAIHDDARQQPREDKRAFREQLQSLNPESADYQQQLTALADEKAQQVRNKIIERGETRAKIFSILTPEQREKLATLKGSHGKHMKGKPMEHERKAVGTSQTM